MEGESDAYFKCGLLEHGFLRVKCDACQAEKLVAFSCMRRGFCANCGARRMAEAASRPKTLFVTNSSTWRATSQGPPLAAERLSLAQGGHVRYALKTPYPDGTKYFIFEPEDFIARLAALVPKPSAHLTRYHSVSAPASPDRDRARFARTTRATGPLSRQDRFTGPRYRTRPLT